MHRREFLTGLANATLAFTLHPLYSACKRRELPKQEQAGTASPSCEKDGTKAEIFANHGHTLNVTAEDVIAGTTKRFHLHGLSPHTHTVVLRPEDFRELKAGYPIQVQSTTTLGHFHVIRISCA